MTSSLAALRPDSLERLIPDYLRPDDATGQETYRLHLERYHFASRHACPGRALDIACGVGYGSRLIADGRPDLSSVLGVDICGEAVAYALEHYATDRVDYRVHDAMRFEADAPYDTVVSLETIEHLPDPEGFIRVALKSVRSGGRFIGSVPVTPSVDANPHHLHDFTKASFRRIGKRFGLREIASFDQVQPFNPFRVVSRSEKRLADMREGLAKYYILHPKSAAKRAWSTVVDGFNNKYLTVVWEKP
jgi:SAM-dependent methyltransferase